ncbi:MAG: hypothetical protein KA163_05965 [Bacteroidia bacterium]|nr:hypothetical protein [Bacteroidia bacterium]
MKKLVLTSALFLSISIMFSQITFVKGYIINLTGDTLKGEVKMNPKKEFDNYNKVYFKDASGVQKNYKPNKVKGYGFDDKHFIASTFDGEPTFYKVLSKGPIMLFEVMFEMQQMNEIAVKNEYYIAKKEDAEYSKLKEKKFKKQLEEYMKDNPEILTSAEEDKKFEIEKVVDLVNQYNDWAKTK